MNNELVKKIRNLTGAGFLDCKMALDESNQDFVLALKLLKKRGIEIAAKKFKNDVEHGCVLIKDDADGNLVMLNFRAQTDFAVKGDTFCNFVEKEADIWLKFDGELAESVYEGESFQDRLSRTISTLGENIVLINSKKFKKQPDKKFSYYMHNKINNKFDDIALLGVVLCFNQSANDECCLKIAKHVAALDPTHISEDEVTDEMRNTNPNINDEVLLNQKFFYDDSLTVEKFMENNKIQIYSFDIFTA